MSYGSAFQMVGPAQRNAPTLVRMFVETSFILAGDLRERRKIRNVILVRRPSSTSWLVGLNSFVACTDDLVFDRNFIGSQ